MKAIRIVYLMLTACIVSVEVYGQNVLAKYSFDENALDLSPNKNNGVIFGATAISNRFDKSNSAFQFDGTSYMDFGTDQSLDLQDGFSISAWINRTGQGTFQTIVGRGYANDGDYWLGLVDTGSHYILRFWLDGEIFDGTVPVLNGWNHVVLTAPLGLSE